jgi:hypothetical protein
MKTKTPKPKRDDGDSWEPRNAEEAQMHELIMRDDVAGMHYLQAAQIRRKRKLTKAERDFLKDFDSIRRRIARDSNGVWKQGFDVMHRGLRLLEYLIHEKHLLKLQDMEDGALYNALSALILLADHLRKSFIRYAEGGSQIACSVVFAEGEAYANAFSRLAIAYPERFQKIAKRSLTMPSLRARNPAFTCDAEAIVNAVHLAEGHHAGNIHDNRSRLGALCHQYIAEIVDLLEAGRLDIKQRGDVKDRLFQLPELRGHAQAWWKAEVKECVHLKFEKMRKNHLHNPALWQELEKVTNHGTHSAMRAAFEKYCRNKLDQIAGRTTAQAAP